MNETHVCLIWEYFFQRAISGNMTFSEILLQTYMQSLFICLEETFYTRYIGL